MRIVLSLMIAWDVTGHASQLVAGRDWSVGAPLWKQWLLCAMWWPDTSLMSGWTAYNVFWSLYWLAALALAATAGYRAPRSRSDTRRMPLSAAGRPRG